MAVSIKEALNLIYTKVDKINRIETINILESNHRIVSDDIFSKIALPRYDNSAMDGYAVKISAAGKTIECKENILYAGTKEIPILEDNEVINIMTGAPVPFGCEAIVPFELVTKEGNSITLPKEIKYGANIRKKGEELQSKDQIICSGQTINSYTIGLLASQGIKEINVLAKPKIAIVSSGDELIDFRSKILNKYQLHNSNSPMFYSRTLELGCDPVIIDNFSDNMQEFNTKLVDIVKNNDIIITSGGASSGAKDFTKEAFVNADMELLFDKIDIKPGKPTAIGKINNTIIIILPGNPLAAMVNFEIFIKPVILKVSGSNSFYHQIIEAKLASDINIKSGKQTVILGNSYENKFYPLKKQSPNMVSVLKNANSMLITTSNVEEIKKDTIVRIIRINKDMSLQNNEEMFTN